MLINPITVTEVTMGLVTGDVIVTAWILMGTLAWVGASVRYFPVCTMTATTRPPDPDQSEMPSRYANWRLLVVLPSSELGSHFCRGYFQFSCQFPPQPRADPAAKVCSTIDSAGSPGHRWTGPIKIFDLWSPASQTRSSQLIAG